MTEPWLLALGLLGAGVLLGAVLGFFVRSRLQRGRGGEATSSVAGAAGLLVFWILTLVGALAAIAMVRPETLEDLPRQILDYTPRLLIAGLIMLAGYALAVAASRLVTFGMERAAGKTVVRIGTFVRWALIGAAGILALAQLGVDTTVLLVLLATVGGSLGLGAALLVGFGGRQLAGEISAGRYVGRYITAGSRLTTPSASGRVVALHPASVELDDGTGGLRHVPYSALLASGFQIEASGD